MGRTAHGVRGMQLRDGDQVVAMEVVSEGGTLLTVCENGFGKRTDVAEYRRQTRGGIGLKNVQTSERNGQVVGVACVSDGDQLLLVTEQGQIIRMTAGDLRPMGRDTQGVRVMDLADGDRLVSLATLREPDDAETTAAPSEPAPLAPAPAETEDVEATSQTKIDDAESDVPDGDTGESE
jgi:DNA gyrase subunit A